jgi:hypothetical protein
MTAMQPEPSSLEFTKEVDFRAKVYRMLSMGMSTAEIETFLHRKIDWQLFSRDTLDVIRDQSQPELILTIPQEMDSELKHTYRSSQYTAEMIQKLDQKFEKADKFFAELGEKIIDDFNFLCGLMAVAFLITIGLIIILK